MLTTVPGPDVDEPMSDLSLLEAAVLYTVAVRTLRTKLRCGEITGYKVRGIRGREWRVSADVLERAGYRPRATEPDGTAPDGRPVAAERELADAWRIARAERHRAEAADRELGYALLECGRLRATVAALERRLGAGLTLQHADV